MSGAGPHPALAAYLRALRARLRAEPGQAARLLEEVEGHLCEAARAEERAGASADEAAARAIARCGAPEALAAALARQAAGAWGELPRVTWRDGRLAATAFGFALLVAGLVVVAGVFDGFDERLRDRLRVNGDVLVLKSAPHFSEYRDVAAAVARVPGVDGAAPVVIVPVAARSGGVAVEGVIAKGVDPRAAPASVELLRPEGGGAPLDPRLLLPSAGPAPSPPLRADGGCGPSGAFVGAALARELRVRVGDCLRLRRAPRAPFEPPASAADDVGFRVTGVFSLGFGAIDARLVYVGLDEGRGLSDGGPPVAPPLSAERTLASTAGEPGGRPADGGRVTALELRVHDRREVDAVTKAIKGELADGLYYVKSSDELNRTVFSDLHRRRALALGVSAAAGLVTAVALVGRRVRREALRLKSLGAPDGAVVRFFTRRGALVTGLGAGAGLPLGYACCVRLGAAGLPLDAGTYWLDRLPAEAGAHGLALAALLALLVGAALTFGLALYARRLREEQGGWRVD
jgi:lipoprotein-releasing system permease protein